MVTQRKYTLIYTFGTANYGGIWRSEGLLCDCMRRWSSLKCLIDHDACRTWQASWAEWRFQREGHLHVETALSHWGREESHSATVAWLRQYMYTVSQAEQQVPRLFQIPTKKKQTCREFRPWTTSSCCTSLPCNYLYQICATILLKIVS